MDQDLRSCMSKGWPPISISICSDGAYRPYGPYNQDDPEELYEQAKCCVHALQNSDSRNSEDIRKEIQKVLIQAIYGSNRIEKAGLGWKNTSDLCGQVFAGEDQDDQHETNVGSAKQTQNFKICRHEPALKVLPTPLIVRARNEVVQHARAYNHLFNAFVVKHEDLTEDLIKETHKILATGVPIIEDPEVSPEQYGGIYRSCHVQAGSTNFSNPRYIGKHMKEMCDNLKKDLHSANEQGVIDPFSIAAKYSLEFVMIHPFQDGNGRTCRMILNAILCRYAGIVIPIGEELEEEEEYMSIKKRASSEMEGHGEYAMFVPERATMRLRALRDRMARRIRTG